MKNINLRIVYLILTLSLLLSFTVGCSTAATSPGSQNPSSVNNQNATTQTNSDTSAVLKKTVISYAGGTCEAPTFVAFQKGFFKEEGLDVELVKSSFDQLRQGLDAGTIDATMANFAWFKPIEQGLNIKLTGGIHTGCISAVTPKDSGITSIKDLKGKIIGVDAIGGGPQIALSAALRANGIDPTTEVEWKAYPGPQLDEAINKNEIQAYMTWDPFPAQAVKDKGYISLLNIGKDEPFSQSYCCFVGISGIVVSKDPEKAAAITRAFLKAAEWVGKNPGEAAQIELDNKYVGGELKLNTELLGSYSWEPSIRQAKDNVRYFIKEQKAQGILEKSTNEDELFEQVFAEVISDYKGK